MAGTEHTGLVLQNRDRGLLEALGTMKIIDRHQAMLVAGFYSITRANTRLLRLKRAGLLRRFFTSSEAGGRKALYALSPKGAVVAGVPPSFIQHRKTERVVLDVFIEHQLAVNTILALVCYQPVPVPGVRLVCWKTFEKPISATDRIVPDGYFEMEAGQGIHPMFLEVDLGTEGQRIWQRKITAFLNLAVSGEFVAQFRRPQFRVLVVAVSERRLHSIRSTVIARTDKIFWFTTLDSINRDGFWSSIWLRPKGDRKQSLL